MTPTEQRLAIAEACGWKFAIIHRYIVGDSWEVTSPDGSKSDLYSTTARTQHSRTGVEDSHHPFIRIEEALEHTGAPDYLNDLNAMHEAEKQASHDYSSFLRDVVSRDVGVPAAYLCDNYLISATAKQRAEAFLLGLNLWKP